MEMEEVRVTGRVCPLVELEQSIHNLRMRWPIGIRRIDDESDAKLVRLEELHTYLQANHPNEALQRNMGRAAGSRLRSRGIRV